MFWPLLTPFWPRNVHGPIWIVQNSAFSYIKIRLPAQNDPKTGFWVFSLFFADYMDNFQFFPTHDIFWLPLSFEHYPLQERVQMTIFSAFLKISIIDFLDLG